MARKSQQTILKRQREQKKAEKAAQKRVRRDERKDTESPPASQGDDPSPGVDEEAGELGDPERVEDVDADRIVTLTEGGHSPATSTLSAS